jgi:hypothetical protein
MDGYGQIGPEKGDYAADVRAVADQLDAGPTLVSLADKGTKLNLVLVPALRIQGRSPNVEGTFGHTVVAEAIGLPRRPDLSSGDLDNWLFVGVIEHGAYWFRPGGYISAGYVADKLDVEVADGETVAEFLTRLHAARVEVMQ